MGPNCRTIISIEAAENKVLFGVLIIAILETQIQVKPKDVLWKRKSQGLIKIKGTKLLKLSGRNYD